MSTQTRGFPFFIVRDSPDIGGYIQYTGLFETKNYPILDEYYNFEKIKYFVDTDEKQSRTFIKDLDIVEFIQNGYTIPKSIAPVEREEGKRQIVRAIKDEDRQEYERKENSFDKIQQLYNRTTDYLQEKTILMRLCFKIDTLHDFTGERGDIDILSNDDVYYYLGYSEGKEDDKSEKKKRKEILSLHRLSSGFESDLFYYILNRMNKYNAKPDIPNIHFSTSMLNFVDCVLDQNNIALSSDVSKPSIKYFKEYIVYLLAERSYKITNEAGIGGSTLVDYFRNNQIADLLGSKKFNESIKKSKEFVDKIYLDYDLKQKKRKSDESEQTFILSKNFENLLPYIYVLILYYSFQINNESNDADLIRQYEALFNKYSKLFLEIINYNSDANDRKTLIERIYYDPQLIFPMDDENNSKNKATSEELFFESDLLNEKLDGKEVISTNKYEVVDVTNFYNQKFIKNLSDDNIQYVLFNLISAITELINGIEINPLSSLLENPGRKLLLHNLKTYYIYDNDISFNTDKLIQTRNEIEEDIKNLTLLEQQYTNIEDIRKKFTELLSSKYYEVVRTPTDTIKKIDFKIIPPQLFDANASTGKSILLRGEKIQTTIDSSDLNGCKNNLDKYIFNILNDRISFCYEDILISGGVEQHIIINITNNIDTTTNYPILQIYVCITPRGVDDINLKLKYFEEYRNNVSQGRTITKILANKTSPLNDLYYDFESRRLICISGPGVNQLVQLGGIFINYEATKKKQIPKTVKKGRKTETIFEEETITEYPFFNSSFSVWRNMFTLKRLGDYSQIFFCKLNDYLFSSDDKMSCSFCLLDNTNFIGDIRQLGIYIKKKTKGFRTACKGEQKNLIIFQ